MYNMSQPQDYLLTRSRIRVTDLQEAKKRNEKWAMLTSYDATSAAIFDHAMIPCILVGDSAAQTVFGHKSTLPITMDELISLARAVVSSCQRALVVADMPFGSYQESPEQALRNATRFMKEAQVHAVKLEGGADFEPHVSLLTKSGIPVMAHVGFTPQSEHTLGGYKVQGRGSESDQVLKDAIQLEWSGAFACVLEMVPSETAARVTNELTIPTIGIGAGPECDAQILVWNDMAGFSAPKRRTAEERAGYLAPSADGSKVDQASDTFELARAPKFVKRYANLSETLFKAVREYADDVKNGKYPGPEHCYN